MNIITIIIERISYNIWNAYADTVEGVSGIGNTIEKAKDSLLNSIELIKKYNEPEHIPDILKDEYKLAYQFRPGSEIDYSNTEQLAKDLWWFLADEPKKGKAIITKRAFLYEVKLMLDTAINHERDKTLNSLSVMSPEQFQQFLELKKLKLNIAQ